jgi:hypothetical protein
MRIRLTLLAALSAVALSAAPAQSTDAWSGGPTCESLFPSYWQPPGQCPVDGKTWMINSQD